MVVRMYNTKTCRSLYFKVIDIDFVEGGVTLNLEDGRKISFDNKRWRSFILE